MKLKTKFFIWISTLVTVAILALGSFMVIMERKLLTTEMKKSQDQLVQRFARVCEESLYQNDLAIFNYLKVLKSERGFLAAYFVDADNTIYVHSNTDLIGKAASPQNTDEGVLKINTPVSYSGEQVGTVFIDLSKEQLDQFLNQSALQSLKRISLVVLLALLVSFLGAYILAQTMVNPIQKIVHGMRKVSQGKLDPVEVSERSDELGWLGNELNQTIHKLGELEEMKRDFVSGVTHELRSPLAAIDSLTNLLITNADIGSVEDRQNSLISVNNNAKRLMKFVDDLLTTARIESHKMDVELRRFDINIPIEEIKVLYQPLASEKGIKLLTEIPKEKIYVQADRDKVLHILTNLVSNAFKFTPAGEVTIKVVPNGKNVKVKVQDSGVGISPADQKQLFNKFYRSRTHAKKIKGTGLGLFITKNLVELNGGDIGVRSSLGSGTEFSFTLPKS